MLPPVTQQADPGLLAAGRFSGWGWPSTGSRSWPCGARRASGSRGPVPVGHVLAGQLLRRTESRWVPAALSLRPGSWERSSPPRPPPSDAARRHLTSASWASGRRSRVQAHFTQGAPASGLVPVPEVLPTPKVRLAAASAEGVLLGAAPSFSLTSAHRPCPRVFSGHGCARPAPAPRAKSHRVGTRGAWGAAPGTEAPCGGVVSAPASGQPLWHPPSLSHGAACS